MSPEIKDLVLGCVLWQGTRNEDGYGTIGQAKAHRLAWEKVHGKIPAGLCILHRCDNPPCVNVNHLFLGTNHDNVLDRHRKGRSKNLFPPGDKHPAKLRRGEKHWCAKLSDADVNRIRKAYALGSSQTELGRRFSVHSATICRIVNNKWRIA